MRYISNDSGQVLDVSFGATIVCGGRECTEYTGAIPEGYDSLIEWFTQECGRLHKWQIIEGDLTLIEEAPEPVALPPFGASKLWENAAPTDNFPEQTIDAPFSAGELALVFFAEGVDAFAVSSVLVQFGQSGRILGKYGDYLTHRTVKAQEDGVYISSGNRMLTYGEWSATDKVLIPVSVYKITGVVDLTSLAEVHAICGTFLCGEVVAGQ